MRKIKITESDIRRMVTESVKRILREERSVMDHQFNLESSWEMDLDKVEGATEYIENALGVNIHPYSTLTPVFGFHFDVATDEDYAAGGIYDLEVTVEDITSFGIDSEDGKTDLSNQITPEMAMDIQKILEKDINDGNSPELEKTLEEAAYDAWLDYGDGGQYDEDPMDDYPEW